MHSGGMLQPFEFQVKTSKSLANTADKIRVEFVDEAGEEDER